MSYREHDPAREEWLRENVPRSQLPRRPQYVEPEGSNEWTSVKLPRQRRPQTAFKTPEVPTPPVQDWSSQFPPARQERQHSPESMLGGHSHNHSPETDISVRTRAAHDWHSQSSHTGRRRERSTGSMLPHRPREDSPETGIDAAGPQPTSPFQDWNSLFPGAHPEFEYSAESMIPRRSSTVSPEIEVGAGTRKSSPVTGVVPRSRSSSIETIIRRLSPQMVIPTIVEPNNDTHIGHAETIKGSPHSPQVLHATFEEPPMPPGRSKASTPSEKALRPKTPHPSVTNSRSTTGLSITPESKDSKDSKGTAPTKPHRSRTVHPPKVLEIKAAFNTWRNGRTAPKALAADLKSALNTMRTGTLRPPNIKQTGNLKPPPQKASERTSAPGTLQPTGHLTIPSNPATSTKSARPATPHPDSVQARTMPRRGTTVRLNGTVAARNLAGTLRQDATMPMEDRTVAASLHDTATAPVDDTTLRVRNPTSVLEVRPQQEHLPAPSLDGAANRQPSAGPSVPPRAAAPSVPRVTTPYAEPYGCNTLNHMPAYFEEVETNNFRAVTASHRLPDRKMIDVYGLPCGHRSICLDPLAPGYAIVFDKAGSVCARIFVGEGQLVAYKNAPFVYIETVLGTRLRVDVSRQGTFVLDEAGELVKEEEGVDVGYKDWADPRAAKPNTKGLMKRGWKACKSWMGTVKGTVKGKFKGTLKAMSGKED